MAATGKRRFNHLAGSMMLLLISSVIALGLAEYAFRTIKEVQWRISAKQWQHELYAMLPDSPLEYALYPGVSRENRIPDTGQTWSYRINADGFRGADFDSESSRKRVLFVGDSYTFGWAVDEDEVLTEAVKRVLVNPPYNVDIEAYNLGVPGYNTFQEYYLLNQVIDRYAPALVVLGYVMNDAEPQRNVPERPSVRYKYVNSWLLAFIKEQLNYYVYAGKPILHTGINSNLDNPRLSVQENGPKWAEGHQAFEDMAALCNKREVPFLVVIFPSHNYAFDDRYPMRMIHEKVLKWADENGVRAVDMLRHVQGKNYKEFRVEGDGHPNGRSFAETANVLAPIIYESLEGSAPLLPH
jgi:lysophospholipase L1-like esterase